MSLINNNLIRKKSKTILLPIVLSFLIFAIIIILISNPAKYNASIKSGFMLFANCVFPGLFPFLVLTKILTDLGMVKKLSNFFSKIMSKLFHVSGIASYIFLMSALCGYPMGAKLTSDLVKSGTIDKAESQKILSFCSVSGPIFTLGTVGVSMFSSMKVGIIIFASHLLSSLLFGLIYCNFSYFKTAKNNAKRTKIPKLNPLSHLPTRNQVNGSSPAKMQLNANALTSSNSAQTSNSQYISSKNFNATTSLNSSNLKTLNSNIVQSTSSSECCSTPYKNKTLQATDAANLSTQPTNKTLQAKTDNNNPSINYDTLLGNSVYNAISTIVIVGAYVTLFFMLIDMIISTGILTPLENALSALLSPFNITKSHTHGFLCGLIEMTRGCSELAKLGSNNIVAITLASGVLSFSGLSIIVQSLTLGAGTGINPLKYIFQKFCHSLLCMLICYLLCLLFL